jgi:hypothetical protein
MALPLRLSSNRNWLLADVEQPTSLSFAGMQPARAVQLLNRPLGVCAGVRVFVSKAGETLELMRWLGSHASELRELVDPEREHFMIVENRSFFFLAPSEIDCGRQNASQLSFLSSSNSLPRRPLNPIQHQRCLSPRAISRRCWISGASLTTRHGAN